MDAKEYLAEKAKYFEAERRGEWEECKRLGKALREVVVSGRRHRQLVAPVDKSFAPHEAKRALDEAARMAEHGYQSGATFTVVKSGVELSVTWLGPRRWLFRGVEYTSISEAGSAASVSIGGIKRGIVGWRFWGLEKQEGT